MTSAETETTDPKPTEATEAPIDDTKAGNDDEEDYGGLEEDSEPLSLRSGGQIPQTFDIDRKSAELSKFVTTILEGKHTCIHISLSHNTLLAILALSPNRKI